jgi:transcriptional regulator with XRE-family HTH domain
VPRTRPAFRFDPTVLRATREARGLTREYVVAEAGCSLGALSLTELGYKRPSPELLARFCEIVGCSLDDLFVPEVPA